MAVYIVLVTIIFQRPTPDYPLFIFAAILPWKWFTTTLNDATLSVTGRQSLIRQIQFPKIVLPSAAVIAGTWSFLFGLIALGIVYLFYLDRLTPWVLLMPVIAAVQFLFTMAVASCCRRSTRSSATSRTCCAMSCGCGSTCRRACTRSMPSPGTTSAPRAALAQPVRGAVRVLPLGHLGQRAGGQGVPAAGTAGLDGPDRPVRRSRA